MTTSGKHCDKRRNCTMAAAYVSKCVRMWEKGKNDSWIIKENVWISVTCQKLVEWKHGKDTMYLINLYNW